MMKTILFMIAVFFAIWSGIVTLMKAIRGQAISAFTLAVTAASLALVITHIKGIW